MVFVGDKTPFLGMKSSRCLYRTLTLIPDQVQKMTMYSAAITTGGVQQEEAAALLNFLSSKAARAAIKVSGLIPVR